MYWALRAWLLGFATRWGLAVDLADMTDLEEVKAALRPGRTKLVWLESPANPLWSVADIAAIAAFFGMSNRIANAFSIPSNPEFYAMGR